MDRLVGRTMEEVGNETTLIVMSDHGFTSLNAELISTHG